MSSWPSPSALAARTQAFPVLTAAQIGRLRPDSKLRKVQPREILFQPDDTEVLFFRPAFGKHREVWRLKLDD